MPGCDGELQSITLIVTWVAMNCSPFNGADALAGTSDDADAAGRESACDALPQPASTLAASTSVGITMRFILLRVPLGRSADCAGLTVANNDSSRVLQWAAFRLDLAVLARFQDKALSAFAFDLKSPNWQRVGRSMLPDKRRSVGFYGIGNGGLPCRGFTGYGAIATWTDDLLRTPYSYVVTHMQ